MSLTAVPVLRRSYPGAHVTWMTGKLFAPIVRQVQGIDEVLDIDETRLLTGSPSRRISELFKILCSFAGRRFDLILNGHIDRRYRLLTLTARGTVRRSFNSYHQFPRQGRHHCDEYVRLVTGLDGPDAEPARFPEVSNPFSSEILKKIAITKKTPVVVITPGGAKSVLRVNAVKRWPIEHYAELARLLIAQGIQVILTGDTSDAWTRPYFGQLPVIDLTGNTSILDLAALYQAVDLVVTHDSGPLHVAVFAGVSVLALFGPTMPLVFGPKAGLRTTRNANLSRVIWGGESLACRPCYDGKHFSRCTDNVCLRSLSPQRVMANVEQMLMEIRNRA
jgi:heptosyltransferase II